MKTVLSILITVICISLFACKKNDDTIPPEMTLQPSPPLSFNLMDVPNGSVDVALAPDLSWKSAENPKGTKVSYDLYLDQNLDPETLVKSDIGGTSFKLDQNLKHLNQYRWKVVATDTEGQTSQSAIHEFTTRYYTFPEEPATSDAAFSNRFSHATTVFNNNIWLTGGNSNGIKNDVWTTEDGKNWTQALAAAPFPERYFHEMATFNNRLWVIGGRNHREVLNDVWSSEDGTNWVIATAFAPFAGKHNHSVVISDDKIWAIAGTDVFLEPTNQVWYSTDGSTWIPATISAAFSERSGQAAVAFQNKLWVIGGFSDGERKNDVWSSEDGSTWKLVTSHADFAPRNSHEAIVFDNKIWVIGGLTEDSGDEANDVWYSVNGIDWTQVNVPDSFYGIAQFSANIFKEQIWIMGGSSLWGDGDEVWATH